ncbi:hypothetical protein N7447_010667 [Penicillium robsamsonii]|uniref:uncharacterized protein n=1 Tax=Penicillium robsamsonii TaxID=1792511 RepID=UPI0025497DB3|nr:uncharacterized protein N7447_010667 [Penicillium robsamsonii]KAJ5811151.1 hypothetical protein N7447_010667 [Penicillium robsamsonii]
MSTNLKNSRSLRLTVAVIIPLALFCYLYSWKQIPSVSNTTIPDPGTTTTTAAPISTSVPPKEHPSPAPIYTLPDKVWHSAKFDNISENQREWTGSWTKKNPTFRSELLTDRSAEAFVRTQYYKTRPDIVEVYEALTIPILRADLFRYLVVLAEGGIWGDLDTSCEKEVSEWVPVEYQNENIDMIVGLEFDFEWRGPGTEVASQFCNWIFVARKSSRNLQIIVDTVVKTLKDIARENAVGIEGITLEMLSDVVNVTGPKIMTIAIMDSLEQLLGRPVDDRDYAHTKRPKLVGDVLIMPGVSFAALQNGNPTDQGDVLVTHHYEGSWKKADAEAKAQKKLKQEQEQEQQQQEEASSPPPPPPPPAPEISASPVAAA